MDSNRFIELATRKLSDNLSQSEEAELTLLLESNPDFKSQFEEMKSHWGAASKFKLKYNPMASEHWESFTEFRNKNSQKEIKVIPLVFKIAASLIIFFGIGFYIYDTSRTDIITYSTGQNETKMIFLPDSSQIWLNQNSKLAFNDEFGVKARKSELIGEAYFEVKHDKNRPFVVESGQTIVKVLGTEFNIRTSEDSVKVSVSSGKVSFSSKLNSKTSTVLEKGMAAIYLSNNKSLRTASFNSNEYAWSSEVLEFKDAVLSQVVMDLEKYFQVKIILINKKLSTCRYTGKFTKPELEEVLKVIALTLDLSYQKINNRYQLSGGGCSTNQKNSN